MTLGYYLSKPQFPCPSKMETILVAALWVVMKLKKQCIKGLSYTPHIDGAQ